MSDAIRIGGQEISTSELCLYLAAAGDKIRKQKILITNFIPAGVTVEMSSWQQLTTAPGSGGHLDVATRPN